LRRVRVWSRTPAHAQEFAQRHTGDTLTVTACETAEEAVRGAGIVCTLTAATAPILQGEWLARGAHVNAVGSSVPPFRELDTTTVTRARVYVDMRECVLRESDDLREPIRESAFHETDIVGELSEMVSGTCQLRTADEQITLFKSVGMAIEDIAALRLAYERAGATNAGAYVEI